MLITFAPTKTAVTTVTCSSRDKFISDKQKEAISFEKKRKVILRYAHYFTNLRQFRAFGAHQGHIKICKKSYLSLIPITSITLLYYY